MNATSTEIPTSSLHHEHKMYSGQTVYTRWADTRSEAETIASTFKGQSYYNVRVFSEPRSPLAPFRIVGWL